jgi:hypothetical protein
MKMLFGREPATILAFLAGILKVAVAFGLPVTETQQTLLNTFAAAVVGVVLLIVLHSGAWYAALVNFAQAGMALVVGFGLDWSVTKQATIMAAVGLGLAVLGIRPQVEAPVSQVGAERRSPLDKSAV